MSVSRMPLASLQEAVSLAVENTLGYPEMIERVVPYGYSEEVLEAVRAMIDALSNASAFQQARQGYKKAATAARAAARKHFHAKVYMVHLQIARVVFRDAPGARRELELDGSRARAFDVWLNQARRFYTNALAGDDLKAALAERGIKEEDLVHGLGLVDALDQMSARQAQEKGLAKQATRDRNVLRDDLRHWLSDYYRFARIAFADKPEWTERIGLMHRSG